MINNKYYKYNLQRSGKAHTTEHGSKLSVTNFVAYCCIRYFNHEKDSVADPGGFGGSVEPPFGSLISMKNTDLNVYFCSKVPFRESTNPPSNPPSQNPGSAPEIWFSFSLLIIWNCPLFGSRYPWVQTHRGASSQATKLGQTHWFTSFCERDEQYTILTRPCMLLMMVKAKYMIVLNSEIWRSSFKTDFGATNGQNTNIHQTLIWRHVHCPNCLAWLIGTRGRLTNPTWTNLKLINSCIA